MTKEELKKEAEEWLNKWELCNKCDHKVQCIEDNAMCPQVVERAYLAGAEPREKQIADLEKENADLKGLKDVATLIRANNDTVTTLMQLNNMLVSKTQQLTKAKEIIHKVCYEYGIYDKDLMEEAKQFLKECK